MSKRQEKARRKAERRAERKRHRKLTPEQRRARRRRRQETMIIFVNGKQKRVPRFTEPIIEGIPVNEFIRENADDIGLLQNEYYELLHEREVERNAESWRNERSFLDDDRPPPPDHPDEFDPVGFSDDFNFGSNDDDLASHDRYAEDFGQIPF